MYGIQSNTSIQKAFIFVIEIICLLLAYRLLFVSHEGNIISLSVFIATLIAFLRLNAMMFIWLPRGIGWPEAIGNSFAFALYFLGFPMLTLYGSDMALSFFIAGWVLFILGSVINTTAELLRKSFKDNPANKGKLYTSGLFTYAIHINYFGDCLWVLGLALLTMNGWSLLIPLLLIILFVTSYIPNADDYLRHTYGDAFKAYEQRAKRLIPFIW